MELPLSEIMRTERVAAFQPAILDWADKAAQLETNISTLKKALKYCQDDKEIMQNEIDILNSRTRGE